MEKNLLQWSNLEFMLVTEKCRWWSDHEDICVYLGRRHEWITIDGCPDQRSIVCSFRRFCSWGGEKGEMRRRGSGIARDSCTPTAEALSFPMNIFWNALTSRSAYYLFPSSWVLLHDKEFFLVIWANRWQNETTMTLCDYETAICSVVGVLSLVLITKWQ